MDDPEEICVEGPAKALVGGNDEDASVLYGTAFEKRFVSKQPVVGKGTDNIRQQKGVGPPALADSWARFILEVATICIALVIWRVFLTPLMRLRMSRVLAM